MRGIIKLLSHIQLLLTDIWKTWAITNQYDGLLPELYKIATWSPGSSTCMYSKPQKARTNCVAVAMFCFEGHYVFFFGEFKHEPKYVKIETSARLTVLFLWRKAIIR